MEEFRKKLYASFDFALIPIADFLIRHRVTPNKLSVAGLLLNLLAAFCILQGGLFLGGFIYLFAGLVDLFDGTVARRGGLSTEFGAFLDSNFDRIAEGVIFAAIAYLFAAGGDAVTAAVTVLALLGSFMVSYTRARAEALGLVGKSGFASRFERLLLISIALMAGFLEVAIYVLSIFTLVTVAQRIWAAYWQLEERKAGIEPPH
ncbi:MAG: CDP-alcohol phosphatidyltransferase family protein [Pseudomonadota bacterium]